MNITIRQPTKKMIGDWRREWAESGSDRKMSFELYKKHKQTERFRVLHTRKVSELFAKSNVTK